MDYIVKECNDGTKITVRDIQNVLLDMMVIVDRICKNNNIDYIMTGGTALGAIRHKGFIPWDDDLDIAIMRKDYQRFIEALNKDLPENYTFHCFEVNKKYNVTIPTMKIRNKNTYIEEVNTLLTNKCDDCNGLFIDVFILDYVSKHKIIDVPFRLVNGLLMLIINGFENISINPVILKRMFIGNAKFYGKINKKSNYIGFDITWTYVKPWKGHIFKYEDIFPTKKVPFENQKFSIANNHHKFLCTDISENYMTPPPENKRFAKHTKDINLKNNKSS